ncbi:unnamed protein product [Tetraodon nigroviridis]|uniref:(spotted green pufferfish) hypothetical protein n=1 Tax=Tetraodon nigroviridis TaxID=99883 RepID=Q4RS58_TETNG|nr:unnamed protein product [Tetraodon nigroviridis]
MKSMVTEGAKAGRWQTVQGHVQSGRLRPSDATAAVSRPLPDHLISAAAPVSVSLPEKPLGIQSCPMRPLWSTSRLGRRGLGRSCGSRSLQQPLIRPPGPGLSHPPTTSQSLGELNTASGQPGLGGGAGKGEGGSGSGEGGGTRGAPRGARGSPAGAGASRYRGGGAGGRSRANPGSWDYMMDQIRKRGLDVKSFL